MIRVKLWSFIEEHGLVRLESAGLRCWTPYLLLMSNYMSSWHRITHFALLYWILYIYLYAAYFI